MARGDVSLYAPTAFQPTENPIVAAGAVQSINAGEPTISADATAGSWTGAVKAPATGDPTTASGHRFTGISKSDSSDTVATAGNVSVWIPFPNTIYRCKALVATNANTQALIDGLRYKRVTFNLTSAVWRIDTATADAATKGIVITGGNYLTNDIYFTIATTVSIFGATN